MELVSPALQGGFLTPGPPVKHDRRLLIQSILGLGTDLGLKVEDHDYGVEVQVRFLPVFTKLAVHDCKSIGP